MSWETILMVLSSSGILAFIFGKVYAQIKRKDAVKLGVQALLRDRLLAEYEKYSELGYAPVSARQNFDNMWKQYHNLGKNGVMDDIHDKFMQLPTKEKGV